MKELSTTALLKKNIKEILKEKGETLSIKEIKELLTGRMNRAYGQSHMAAAFKQLLDDEDYVSPGRGEYCYIGAEAAKIERTENWIQKLYNLYKNTADQAAAILNQADFVNCSEEELQYLLELRQIVSKTREFEIMFQKESEKL